MAKISYHPVPFQLDAVAELAPITASIFSHDPHLADVMRGQFHYPANNTHAMPFYCFSEAECRHLCESAEHVYAALVDSLALLFDRYEDMIPTFYGEDFIRQYPQFVDYAKYTYFENHEALAGRFDVAYDFEKERVLGFYEFNGDTPVMLFESVALQDWMATQVDSAENQSNIWYENVKSHIGKLVRTTRPATIGLFANMRAIEDALTAEQIRWTLDDHIECHLHDISDIEYDFTFDKPFHVNGQQFDYIYILLPWEEMLESSPEIIYQWRNWCESVRFFEPAWRWFVSNKGSLAWLYWLMTSGEEPEFAEQYQAALPYLLPTSLTPLHDYETYVEKPMMGRLSSNIRIIHHGEVVHQTAGGYGETPMVYQAFCEPGRLYGRASAIVGIWMAPYGHEPLVMEASTLCIREFDDKITSIENERFVPHLVV